MRPAIDPELSSGYLNLTHAKVGQVAVGGKNELCGEAKESREAKQRKIHLEGQRNGGKERQRK